jgi:hypothetical protein
LDIDIPLCPGDFLLFNALIPQCISLILTDDVMCVSSMNLKSSVVGMDNNNLFQVTSSCLDCFQYLSTNIINCEVHIIQLFLSPKY